MIRSAWFRFDSAIRSWAHLLHDLVGQPFQWLLGTTWPGGWIRRNTHPNFWSFLRIPMALIVGLCLSTNAKVAAIIVYLVAVFTDRFDGEFARLDRKTSSMGELIDTTADSILQSAILLGLAHSYPLFWVHHSWCRWPYLLVGLEVVKLTGGPLLAHLPAFRHCHRARQPNMSGKYKMVATSLSVVLIMLGQTSAAQWWAALATLCSLYSLGRHGWDAILERADRPVLVERRVAQL